MTERTTFSGDFADFTAAGAARPAYAQAWLWWTNPEAAARMHRW
jgi:hypothetical protein